MTDVKAPMPRTAPKTRHAVARPTRGPKDAVAAPGNQPKATTKPTAVRTRAQATVRRFTFRADPAGHVRFGRTVLDPST